MSRTRRSASSGVTRRAGTTARTARGTSSRALILEIADCSRPDRARVRHRLERGPRQLAAQARHARERATPLPRGARERVRAVRPASARARSAAAGVKPGTGPAPARRRVTRGCGETRQTHRPQKPAGQPMGVRLPPSALTKPAIEGGIHDARTTRSRFEPMKQAPPRIPVRDEGQGRAERGRRQGAARAARQRRPLPVRLRPPLSGGAAVTAAAFDGAGRAEYIRQALSALGPSF